MRFTTNFLAVAVMAISAGIAQAAILVDFEPNGGGVNNNHNYVADDTFLSGGSDQYLWSNAPVGGPHGTVTDGSPFAPLSGLQSGRIHPNTNAKLLFKNSKETLTSAELISMRVSLGTEIFGANNDPVLNIRGIFTEDSGGNPASNHTGLHFRFYQDPLDVIPNGLTGSALAIALGDGAVPVAELQVYDTTTNTYRDTGLRGFGANGSDLVGVEDPANSQNLVEFELDWDNQTVSVFSTDIDGGGGRIASALNPISIDLIEGSDTEATFLTNPTKSAMYWWMTPSDDPGDLPPSTGFLHLDDVTIGSAIPEPTTLALIGLGLGCLGLGRKQRS